MLPQGVQCPFNALWNPVSILIVPLSLSQRFAVVCHCLCPPVMRCGVVCRFEAVSRETGTGHDCCVVTCALFGHGIVSDAASYVRRQQVIPGKAHSTPGTSESVIPTSASIPISIPVAIPATPPHARFAPLPVPFALAARAATKCPIVAFVLRASSASIISTHS